MTSGRFAVATAIFVIGLATPSAAQVAQVACNGPDAQSDPACNHLKCYKIKGPSFLRTIQLNNQFGQEKVLKLVPQFLCLPTKKTKCVDSNGLPCGSDPWHFTVGGVGHYKCYKIGVKQCPNDDCSNLTGQFPPVDVALRDQFESEMTTAGPPKMLCVPVAKTVGTTTTTTSITSTTSTTSTTTTLTTTTTTTSTTTTTESTITTTTTTSSTSTSTTTSSSSTSSSSTSSSSTSSSSTTTSSVPLDHYTAYWAFSDRVGPGPRNVALDDQFRHEDVNVQGVAWFMPPVDKITPMGNHTGFHDPVTHFTCYGIVGGTFGPVSISVTNQFGANQQLQVSNPQALCVPTEKDPGPVPKPLLRDHYKCYQASGQSLGIGPVGLVDQFTTQFVMVNDPKFFCNPVQKTFGSRTFPITSTEHLTCYNITLGVPDHRIHSILNQFLATQIQIDIQQKFALCVPSQKTFLCQDTGGGVCGGTCPTGTTCKPLGTNPCTCAS